MTQPKEMKNTAGNEVESTFIYPCPNRCGLTVGCSSCRKNMTQPKEISYYYRNRDKVLKKQREKYYSDTKNILKQKLRGSLKDRLSKTVQKTDGCWNYTKSLNNYGYAQMSLKYKTVMVHRIMYELLRGKIPKGMTLDHLCRNRGCVNPYHLEVVSRVENVMRGESFSAKNKRKTHCIRGHKFDFIYKGRRKCSKCIKINGKIRYKKRKSN